MDHPQNNGCPFIELCQGMWWQSANNGMKKSILIDVSDGGE